MKKVLLNIAMMVSISLMMTSCFTYTAVVGKGSQTGVEVTGKNHFLINGLFPLGVSNAKQMAGGASDYDLTVTHSFIDGLIGGITFGIYTPTTTTVKK
ncbi:MAG: Bor family protein [Arcicella sp.]|nr:Bor family protein [Arcicella sp.]